MNSIILREVFFDYLFIKQNGMLEDKLLAEMPTKLRAKVGHRERPLGADGGYVTSSSKWFR